MPSAARTVRWTAGISVRLGGQSSGRVEGCAVELDRSVPCTKQDRLFSVSSLAMKSNFRQPDTASDVPHRASDGSQFWRSLEELEGDDAFFVALRREFPEYANRLTDGATRRQFLQLMGASLALA